MSHWAEINKKNVVIRVLVGDNNEPDEGESFVNSLGGTWIKTSYNGTIRKNFAGPGFIYDKARDAFIPPKPDNQIGFDEETCQWIVPETEMPDETIPE
jgi:hypothetical protein